MGMNDKPDDPFANVSKSIAAVGDLPAGDVPETKRKSAPKPKSCYLFHDSGWSEILSGFNLKEAAAVLQERGFLVPGDGGRPKRKQRVGDQSPRFYTVRASILEWDGSDLGKSGDIAPPNIPPAAPVD